MFTTTVWFIMSRYCSCNQAAFVDQDQVQQGRLVRFLGRLRGRRQQQTEEANPSIHSDNPDDPDDPADPSGGETAGADAVQQGRVVRLLGRLRGRRQQQTTTGANTSCGGTAAGANASGGGGAGGTAGVDAIDPHNDDDGDTINLI